MRSFSLILLLSAIFVNIEPAICETLGSRGSALSFLTSGRNIATSQRSDDVDLSAVIASRQAKAGVKRVPTYNNVVAPAPREVSKSIQRRQGPSASLPVNSVLVVYRTDTVPVQFLGYVSASPSTFGKGDYSYSTDINSALVVSVTVGITDVQRFPIVSSSPYPYLAGMVGPTNPGYNAPPFIPSPDMDANNYNFGYLTNANANSATPYGPAYYSPNADNEQPMVETGMFRLGGPEGTQLLPNWVNSDSSVVTGQSFALDFDDNIYFTANYPQTANVLVGPTVPISIIVAPQ